MAWPPNSFNWNWTDLPSTASLEQVIKKVNWIGQNLEEAYTNWIEGNNSSIHTHVVNAEDKADKAATSAGNAATAASNAQTAADAARKGVNRCSYLRGAYKKK